MERYFVIGETKQCGNCFSFFPSIDALRRPNNPHNYCSEPCRQIAAVEADFAAIEFQRLMEAA